MDFSSTTGTFDRLYQKEPFDVTLIATASENGEGMVLTIDEPANITNEMSITQYWL